MAGTCVAANTSSLLRARTPPATRAVCAIPRMPSCYGSASRRPIITKVYRQQGNHFDSGDTRESIPDRIVSVRKPYIRPIVRGKENKNVEFGAKSNNIQVDGITFFWIDSFFSRLLRYP